MDILYLLQQNRCIECQLLIRLEVLALWVPQYPWFSCMRIKLGRTCQVNLKFAEIWCLEHATAFFRQATTESSPEYLKMAEFDLKIWSSWVTSKSPSASKNLSGLASAPFENNEGLVGPWLIHQRGVERWPVWCFNEALRSEANEGLGSPQLKANKRKLTGSNKMEKDGKTVVWIHVD